MSEAYSINPENEPQGLPPEERRELDAVPDLLSRRFAGDTRTYWEIVWDYFRGNTPAYIALWIMFAMAVVAVLSPFIANHRPYYMVMNEGSLQPGESAILDPGLNFPLFANLGVTDWILLFGLVQSVLAVTMYRRAKRHGMQASSLLTTFMLIVAATPIVPALLFSPEWRAFLAQGDEYQNFGLFLGQGIVWCGSVLAVVVAGVVIIAMSAKALYHQVPDEFGNLAPLGPILRLLCGTVLLLIGVSMFGTLGVRSLDITDYYRVAQREGVRALFPPIAYDYIKPNPYMSGAAPLGPHTRVHPSGGSTAASDLNLTDAKRDESLAAMISGGGGKLSRETPLASLNEGAGVGMQDAPVTEMTIVSHSFDTFPVRLLGSETIGDVLDRINEATQGKVIASVGPRGERIVFDDQTFKRPIMWMGTDLSGSDVAARLVRATRVALSIGFVSTSIALTIGVTMGALMGYFGGWVDVAGMRIIEIFMAIPRLFLLLTIIAFIPPEFNDYMLYAMMAVIGATSWMTSARFIRAEFFKLRDQDFVHSATACGLPTRSILFKHMLPNGVTPVLVDASFGVAAAIFIETGLSFLGFGIKPPHPSWGQMLSSAIDPASGVFRWWLAVFPGIMIFLTVFCFNLIGDALRDAIDPKLQKAQD